MIASVGIDTLCIRISLGVVSAVLSAPHSGLDLEQTADDRSVATIFCKAYVLLAGAIAVSVSALFYQCAVTHRRTQRG
jgi:hypothetical protein